MAGKNYPRKPVKWATTGQVAYIKRLLTQNKLYDGEYDRLWKLLAMHETDMLNPGDAQRITSAKADEIITWVKHDIEVRGSTTTVARASSTPSATPGVYRKDGEIYVVVPNKAGTRVYAKKLVESPPRMTENGEVVDFELEYVRGVVFNLTEDDKMKLADAKDLIIKYGRCIKCKRTLKNAKTLQTAEDTGILVGPVCRKYFAA